MLFKCESRRRSIFWKAPALSMVPQNFPESSFEGGGDWTEIFVESLTLDMFIGIHDHEKRAAQPVEVSVSARVDPPRTDRDDLSGVVSYGDVVRTIQRLADAGHVHLVETFAERIAAACLLDPRVRSVTVRVAKPQACALAQSVGATIFRTRKEETL